MGNPLAVTDAMGNTVSYEYDAAGRLITATLPNGGVTKYHYNINGNLSGVENAAGERTSYVYDAVGNLISVTAPDGGTVSYTYRGIRIWFYFLFQSDMVSITMSRRRI